VELENLMQANKVKGQALQRASDQSVALQFLCDHFIKSIAVFLQNTHTLKSYLEDETRQAKGYIDVLQELITSSSSDGRTGKTFLQNVREACGVTGNINVPSRQVLECVEGAIRRAHRQEAFLASSRIHTAPLPPVDDIAEFQAKQKSLDARLTTILREKIDQAKASDKLVADIGVLVKETTALVT